MKNILTKKKNRNVYLFLNKTKLKLEHFCVWKKLCCNKYRKYKYKMTITKGYWNEITHPWGLELKHCSRRSLFWLLLLPTPLRLLRWLLWCDCWVCCCCSCNCCCCCCPNDIRWFIRWFMLLFRDMAPLLLLLRWLLYDRRCNCMALRVIVWLGFIMV